MKRIIAPAGRGSVMVIAMLLLSSASLRILTSASGALAQEGQTPSAQVPPTAARAAMGSAKKNDKLITRSISELGATRDEISGLITALTEREAHVVQREQKLEMRLQALSIADAEIEKRLEMLTKTETALRSTLSLADEASEKDLQRLTSVYESMKPKDAAILFEEMEPNFAAGFLGRMRPEIAAQVLAGLSPPVAYSISVILAGRNATAPKT